MANTELSLDSKKEKKSADKKVEGFLTRHRTLVIGLLAAAVVAVIAIVVIQVVMENATKKNLAAIDSIEFALTNPKALPEGYSASDVASLQQTALDGLKPYLSKSGITGLRANMLAADVAFQQKNYAEALSYYLDAAKLSKKSYTAPLCWFNAGVCAEELGNTSDALTYYQNAVDYDGEFLLVAHALFSLGRVKESLSDYAGAKEVYQKLVDSHEGDTWTNLAQSRLIALKAQGLIE